VIPWTLLIGMGAALSGQATRHTLPQDSLPPLQVLGGTLAFDARATAGRFTGTTRTVSGRASGGSLTVIRGWVEAPAASLVTGNDRRDRDMYKSLESDRFPAIRFDLDSARSLTYAGDSVLVRLEGRFTLHGVVRQVSIPAALLRSGDTVALSSAFNLNVKDYQIGGLSKFLGLFRMEEVIGIRVDVLFGPVSPPVSPRHDADTAVTRDHHVPPDQIPGKPPGAVDDSQGQPGGREANDRGWSGESHTRDGGAGAGPHDHRSAAFQGDHPEKGGLDAELRGNLSGKGAGSRLAESDGHGVAAGGHQRAVAEEGDARWRHQHENAHDHHDDEQFDESESTGRHEGKMPEPRVGARRQFSRAVA